VGSLFHHLTHTQDHLDECVNKIEDDWNKIWVDREGKILSHFKSSDKPEDFEELIEFFMKDHSSKWKGKFF